MLASRRGSDQLVKLRISKFLCALFPSFAFSESGPHASGSAPQDTLAGGRHPPLLNYVSFILSCSNRVVSLACLRMHEEEIK